MRQAASGEWYSDDGQWVYSPALNDWTAIQPQNPPVPYESVPLAPTPLPPPAEPEPAPEIDGKAGQAIAVAQAVGLDQGTVRKIVQTRGGAILLGVVLGLVAAWAGDTSDVFNLPGADEDEAAETIEIEPAVTTTTVLEPETTTTVLEEAPTTTVTVAPESTVAPQDLTSTTAGLDGPQPDNFQFDPDAGSGSSQRQEHPDTLSEPKP